MTEAHAGTSRPAALNEVLSLKVAYKIYLKAYFKKNLSQEKSLETKISGKVKPRIIAGPWSNQLVMSSRSLSLIHFADFLKSAYGENDFQKPAVLLGQTVAAAYNVIT